MGITNSTVAGVNGGRVNGRNNATTALRRPSSPAPRTAAANRAVPSAGNGQRAPAQAYPSGGSRANAAAKPTSQNLPAAVTAPAAVKEAAMPVVKEEEKGFFGNLWSGITDLGSSIKDGITDTVGNVLEAGRDGVKNLIGTGSDLAENAMGALGSLFENGKEGVNFLMSKGSQAVEGTKELLSSALETGKKGFQSLLEMGGQAVDGIKEIVKNAPEIIDSLLEKGGQAAEGAMELIQTLPEKSEGFVDDAKDFIWGTIADVVEGGAELVHDIGEGYNDFKEKLPGPLQDIADLGVNVLGMAGQTALDGLGFFLNPLLHLNVAAADFVGIDTAEIGAYLLDMDEDTNDEWAGVYHARTDARQSLVGYNVLYDLGFDVGTNIEEPELLEFTVDDQDYVLWGWKADYLNLGAGAELGIYKRMGDTDHWLVDPDDPQDPNDSSLVLPMSMEMTDQDGEKIASYHPEEEQWWITSFNSNLKGLHPDQFNAEFTVDLSGDEEMCEAIAQAVAEKEREAEENGETSNWSMSVDEDGKPILNLRM